MSNIFIDIAAEFTGKKAFKQAESSSSKLSGTVKSLAKTLGVAFSARAVVQFAQASVKAFVADDNAARSLGVTLKNLGLETGNTSIYVNDMISRLEKQTGVMDDQLRPAMDKLLRATGSITKSQTLLNLALDISAGTGKDLTTVSQGLQKAYLGNNASLGRLGVGLTKAELASSSFEEIQARLTKLFAGQASSAAESYAGQLNILAIASNNVKEIIGKGIVDALVMLGEDQSVTNLATQMENLATNTGDVIRGIGVLAKKIESMPVLPGFDIEMVPILGTYISLLMEAGKKARNAQTFALGKNPVQSGTYLNKPKKSAADTAAADAAAKLAALQKKQLKLSQDALKLKQAGSIFDLKQIQIVAALKGNISEEERTRLQLMLAIEKEQVDKVDELEKKLKEIQAKNAELAAALSSLPAVVNPFSAALQGAIDLTNATKGLADGVNIYGILAADAANAGALAMAEQKAALADYLADMKMYAAEAAAAITGIVIVGGQMPSGGKGGSSSAGAYLSSGFPGADIPPNPNAGTTGTTVTNNITVNGAVDALGTARVLIDVLNEAANSTTSEVIGNWYKSKSLAG